MPTKAQRGNQWSKIVVVWKFRENKMIEAIDKKKTKRNNHNNQRHNQER